MQVAGTIVNFSEFKQRLATMPSEVFERAAVSAMNKTVAKARTAMSREIRAQYNLSASKVNEALRVKKAWRAQGFMEWEAALESPSQRGRALNLINFSARATQQGVTVAIKKGAGRKLIKSAFIANQGRTVFIRTGKARLPIKGVQTIDVPQMFNARRINERVVEMIRAEFPIQFEREARYFMSKA